MDDKMGRSEIFRKKLGGGIEKDLNHSHYIDYTMLHCISFVLVRFSNCYNSLQ